MWGLESTQTPSQSPGCPPLHRPWGISLRVVHGILRVPWYSHRQSLLFKSVCLCFQMSVRLCFLVCTSSRRRTHVDNVFSPNLSIFTHKQCRFKFSHVCVCLCACVSVCLLFSVTDLCVYVSMCLLFFLSQIYVSSGRAVLALFYTVLHSLILCP